MSSVTVYPCTLSGKLSVPGDKSISQRVALLASLASGTSEISGYLDSEDSQNTLKAVKELGASYHLKSNGNLLITGVNGFFKPPNKPLNLGNSGTGSRLLAGLLAGSGINAEIIGDESLSRRPMNRIQDPLSKMGAKIKFKDQSCTLPMKINGGGLTGITYHLPVPSAQVKSCVLFAGLFAKGETKIIEPRPTRDHTEKLFQHFNIPIEVNGNQITIDGDLLSTEVFACKDTDIPGDFSSAAFWITAAACSKESVVLINNVGLNPRRTALLNVLKRMGAKINIKNKISNSEPFGSIEVYGGSLYGTVIEGDEIPNLIDELPVLAVAGALADGYTIIRNAEELRVKESDRIHEMVKSLRKFGVRVDEFEDGMKVYGKAELRTPSESISCNGDHRIAMSLAILNLFSDGSLKIDQVECVDTSYPTFWDDLVLLGGRVDRICK